MQVEGEGIVEITLQYLFFVFLIFFSGCLSFNAKLNCLLFVLFVIC
jgi:hypothetical protein